MTRADSHFQLQPSEPVLKLGKLRNAVAAFVFGTRLNRPTQSEQSRATDSRDRKKEPNHKTTSSSASKFDSFAMRAESFAIVTDLPPSIICTKAAALVSNSNSTTSHLSPVRMGKANLNF